MPLTTTAWWLQRLRGGEGWFDVTKTWTKEQRESETLRIWAAVKPYLNGAEWLVDFGCGLQRFRPHALAAGMHYLAVDVLPELVQVPADDRCRGFLFDRRSTIPPDLDGDAALYCLILQHLDQTDTIKALCATRAGRRVIVEGVWKASSYTLPRDLAALQALMRDCGAKKTTGTILQTPLEKYKVVAGEW